jgi:NAD(P)-dependent dehydrogenase (short-subunit alcohol dehydrogenase family)
MSIFDTKKVTLVTGASSGIGEAVALRLAEAGAMVCAAARRLDRMEHLKEKGIRVLPLDLTDEASIEECHRTIATEAGGINILVNNAGYGNYGSIEEIPLDVALQQFEVNLVRPRDRGRRRDVEARKLRRRSRAHRALQEISTHQRSSHGFDAAINQMPCSGAMA